MVSSYEELRSYEAFRDRRERMYNQLVAMSVVMVKLVTVMTLFFLIMTGARPLEKILNLYADRLAIENSGFQAIPDLEQRVKDLSVALKGLSNESIEERLSRIEKAIQAGQIRPEDIGDFLNIKSDIQKMKSFMSSDPSQILELRTLTQDYSAMKQVYGSAASKSDLEREIRFLTNLYFAGLGLAALIIAILGVSWFRSIRPAKEQDAKPAS